MIRCLLCHRFSWQILCEHCLKWIDFSPRVRFFNGFRIYSFFDYEVVSELIQSKYSLIGSRVFKVLSQRAAIFMRDQHLLQDLHGIRGVGIDDVPKGGYAHTAIIARAFHKIACIKPIYGGIYAMAHVKYAGKNLAYRRKNPKKFQVNFSAQNAPYGVILYDDVLTTGTTMLEAVEVMKKKDIIVHFGIALAGMEYQGTSFLGQTT